MLPRGFLKGNQTWNERAAVRLAKPTEAVIVFISTSGARTFRLRIGSTAALTGPRRYPG